MRNRKAFFTTLLVPELYLGLKENPEALVNSGAAQLDQIVDIARRRVPRWIYNPICVKRRYDRFPYAHAFKTRIL